MKVNTVWVTPNAEEIVLYCARVSSPNQDSKSTKLIRYLIDNKHWSPFELASMCVEINTSRAISPQILRHRSFHFQEFSQRYASVEDNGVVIYDARRQDRKNRQNSIDDIPEFIKADWRERQQRAWGYAYLDYKWALDQGIAKECARMILPLSTKTRMYMHGTIRDWIHYILVRTDSTAQKEHREIAAEIKLQFCLHFPITSAALGWSFLDTLLSENCYLT